MAITTSKVVSINLTSGSKVVTFEDSPDLGWAEVGDLIYIAGQRPLVIGSTTPIALANDSPLTVSATDALVVASYVNLRTALQIINKQSEEFAEWYRKLTSGNSLWNDVRTIDAATYEFVDGDEYVYFIYKDVADLTVNIPNDTTFNFPIGTRMATDRYIGAGAIDVTVESPVVLTPPASGLPEVGDEGKVAIYIKTAANAWRMITNTSNYTGFLLADGSDPMTGNLLLDVSGTSGASVTAVDDNGGYELKGGSEVALNAVNAAGVFSRNLLTFNATTTEVCKPDDTNLLEFDTTTGTVVYGLTGAILKGLTTGTQLLDEAGGAHIVAADGEKTDFPFGAKSNVAPESADDLVNLAYFAANAGAGASATIDIVTVSSSITLDSATHLGKRLKCTNSSDIILTCPAVGVTGEIGGGFNCLVTRAGTGKVTFAGETGVAITSPGSVKTVSEKGTALIMKGSAGADEWTLGGALGDYAEYVTKGASDGLQKVAVNGILQALDLSEFVFMEGSWNSLTDGDGGILRLGPDYHICYGFTDVHDFDGGGPSGMQAQTTLPAAYAAGSNPFGLVFPDYNTWEGTYYDHGVALINVAGADSLLLSSIWGTVATTYRLFYITFGRTKV